MAARTLIKLTILPVFFLGLLQGCTKFEKAVVKAPTATETSAPAPIEPASQSAATSNRLQETFVLPNGLEVLLVSSPGFTKASAGMAIPVGSWSDPEEHQGLAHFLEHMLFLGTAEFPSAGEYQAVVSKNGGYANAYTSKMLTNYFFEVNTDALPEVIRRFSRFFVSPTLDPQFVEKERNAVHSEFDKNIRSDGWRFWQMLGLMEPAGHPNRKFNIGSRTTLANATSDIVRSFYEKHYSSDTMKLVILGSQSLAELRAMAEKNFADVPNRGLKAIPSTVVVPKSEAGNWMEIKSIGSKDEITLAFPSSAYDSHWKSKPGVILSAVLGAETQGSLASILKRKQQVTRLSASSFDLAPFGADSGYFYVSLELTAKGLKERTEVLKTVFAYIGQLQSEGVKNYTFSEKQTMARLAFENRGLVDGADEAARIAALMLEYPALEVDQRSSLLFAPDSALVDTFLKGLSPDNATVIVQSPTAHVDKVEPIFGTEYSLKKISSQTKTAWKKAMSSPLSGYAYPAPNTWIPTSFTLFKTESNVQPRTLVDDTKGKLWFLQESGPETKPTAYASVRIWTPEISRNPRSYLLAMIYGKAFDVTQIERLAPLTEAGYSVGLAVTPGFVQIQAQGYSEKFAEVLGDLLVSPAAKLNAITLTDDDLVKIKGDLKQDFAGNKVNSAINRSIQRKKYLSNSPSFEVEEYQDLLDSVTTDEFNAFAKTMFSRVYVDGLVYGNVLPAPVTDLVSNVVTNLGAQPLPAAELAPLMGTENLLKPGQKFVSVVSDLDNNNAIAIQLDTGLRTYESGAVNLVLGSLIEDQYYNEMRTVQQLGYIVQGGASNSPAAIHLDFYIQSGDYAPDELAKRTSTFWADFLKNIDTALAERFVSARDGLILELSRKSPVMSTRYEQLQRFFLTRNADWSYQDGLVQALGKLTPEEVKAHAVKSLSPDSQARLSVYYYGTGQTVPTEFGDNVKVENKPDFERLRTETK